MTRSDAQQALNRPITALTAPAEPCGPQGSALATLPGGDEAAPGTGRRRVQGLIPAGRRGGSVRW
ncbi:MULTISPECIES: hypothetical protein [Actinoalloteichus]|uniref:Uncharacterized protein n=1 Tax=Actinoalloteichus fjordicus TaxID=1612552 RepID=A0AAC9LES0_9PSEU|nr:MULTISPECIES: hypothetical protein [Actinoalloteichus]APU15510.1 hypothetical protein UA74_17410 [Actinoalloteichus fjordicus]APU21577.1 hypothetical protein UA75_17935 [Actinoalloteichus sp. GBA129-24]